MSGHPEHFEASRVAAGTPAAAGVSGIERES